MPLAAGVFHHRVTRRQVLAVLLMAAGLATLPIGFSTAADHLEAARLVPALITGAILATALGRVRAAAARAAAAGIFYGLADAAIKAVSLEWHRHGAASLASGWALVAVAGTFAGFVCFQAALEDRAAVPAISLMTAATALVALVGGVSAFGESLGAGAAASVMHGLAIAVVLAGVPRSPPPTPRSSNPLITEMSDRRRTPSRCPR